MKTIQLTRGFETIVDDEDYDYLVSMCKWHTNNDTHNYYASGTKNYKSIKMHRVIMSRALGRELQKTEIIDHINRNTLDNTKENLRVTTHTGNMHNQSVRKNNKTGYKGVSKHSKNNGYVAQIGYKSKHVYIGTFKTPENAATAYNFYAWKYRGEFATYNK